jgi:O-antigen/teichoic acid export membrane protein
MIASFRSWFQDRLFVGVLKNSGYLFSSHSIAAVLGFIQGVFAARLLGVDGYGLVSGTVIAFASNTNRLISFRMNEVVVKAFHQHMAEDRKDRAAAAVKGAAVIETVTSIIAYGMVLLLAPLAARYLAKDPSAAGLFSFYGIALLSNFAFETSSGVLQANNRFKRIAAANLVQSILTAVLIFLAFLMKAGPFEVLGAYLVGKTFTGLAVVVLAFQTMDNVLGKGWWRASLRLVTDWKEKLRFALSTNLSGTVNLAVRDSETIIIALFRSQAEVGYFRLALGLINMVMTPVDPLIWPTYTEITRTIARKEWQVTRSLLKKVSTISAAWTLAVGGGLALLGWWLIPTVYGAEFAPTYPALVILLVGYGFANIFQWNRPLLLALGMPGYPVKVSALLGVVKTFLTFTVMPFYGYIAEAAILTVYFVTSIGMLLQRGLREIKNRSAQAEPGQIE